VRRTLALSMSFAALAACSDMGGERRASGSCADGVRQLRASPVLGVQGGGQDQTLGRAKADLFLDKAADAAARGDEATCRRNLDLAHLSLTY
jgi:hypothetical protein